MNRTVLTAALMLPFLLVACHPENNPEGGNEGDDGAVAASSIVLNKTSMTIWVQTIHELVATVEPSECTDAVKWETSDAEVATVKDGSVLGVGVGVAVITASAGGKTAECQVTVIPVGAVDLGVYVIKPSVGPRRVFWAQSNVDASGPHHYGNYFAWGEYNVHYNRLSPLEWKTGMSDGYAWSDYKFAKGAENKITRYCPSERADLWAGTGSPDGKTTLDKGDDVAREVMGGRWRTPTRADWDALLTQCRWEPYTLNGKKGFRVISKADETNEIFLPLAGYWNGTVNNTEGEWGYYWMDGIYFDVKRAYAMQLSASTAKEGVVPRCYGCSVRAVMDLD